MVFNLSFDPLLLTYDTSYENTLDFSPAFQEFARDLASRLISTYEIRRKHVIEIGCGNGDFLKMLCQTGDNQGFGLDPSYDGASMAQAGDPVPFVRDLYSEAYIDRPADLICCRHVLEHLPNPRELLVSLRRMLRNRLSTVVYFEVPNAESVLGGATMWDVNYPHCLYFSWPALARLFREAGFFVVRLESCFGHQFLYAEAMPGETAAHHDQEVAAIERVVALASRFDQQFKATVSYWSALIRGAIRARRRVALWGSGAKGTMFLNLVPAGAKIDVVVDLNPRKQGMYVPGTGQQVVCPEQLREFRPDLILISNPLYESEIREMVRKLGLVAELVPILSIRPSAPARVA